MPFEHAVVLGGSVAGLLAATALSESFGSVTIVERDALPVDEPDARQSRRGVPHGDQIHHMLALGSEQMEALLPGLDAELIESGCTHHDPTADFAQYLDGQWLLRVRSGLQITCFQRPVFEWAIRRRVLALDNVHVRRALATGLVASADRRRVIGATLGDDQDPVFADLVVDATGRGSSASAWLQALGYGAPEESQLRIYMGYSTYLIECPAGVLPEGLDGIACTNGTAGAAIRPCGGGRHLVMAGGVLRNYPPRDLVALASYFEGLDTPHLAEYLEKSKVVSDVTTFRLVGDHRRYWERLDDRPEGFVLVGDAVSYYNPMYGQGMSLAALGAVVLRDVAADAGGEVDGFAAAAQTAIGRWVDVAFGNAVRLDSAYDGCDYVNLAPPPRQPELERAIAGLATEDPEVVIAIRRAILQMDNSFLQAESIQHKIADWIQSGRTVDPKVTDPMALPEIEG